MTRKDRSLYNKYMKTYMLKRYHKRMNLARDSLGNKCVECGSGVNLELDHINPETKLFTISELWSVSEKKFFQELEKCQLLCQSCHITKTLKNKGQVSARETHGTISSYKYCKCQECRGAWNEHCKAYKKRRKLGLDAEAVEAPAF